MIGSLRTIPEALQQAVENYRDDEALVDGTDRTFLWPAGRTGLNTSRVHWWGVASSLEIAWRCGLPTAPNG